MMYAGLATLAQKYTQYDMIQDHTELPEYPATRTNLLYAFLRRGSGSVDLSELFSLVTSLVQMGLDTHDMVENADAEGRGEPARSRQMKVLAGDYFSSRYYYLLAKEGQVDVIRLLSEAICEVNRLKTNIYLLVKQLKLTAEEYFQQTVRIKSELFMTFSRYLGDVYSRVWPDMLQGLTACEVLVQEIGRLQSMKQFPGGWGYWHILHHSSGDERGKLIRGEMDERSIRALDAKYHATSQLRGRLEDQLAKIKDICEHLGMGQEFVDWLGEPFLRYLSAPRALEDG